MLRNFFLFICLLTTFDSSPMMPRLLKVATKKFNNNANRRKYHTTLAIISNSNTDSNNENNSPFKFVTNQPNSYVKETIAYDKFNTRTHIKPGVWSITERITENSWMPQLIISELDQIGKPVRVYEINCD